MSRVSPTQYLSNKEPKLPQPKMEKIFSDMNDPIELKLLLLIFRHPKISRYVQLVLVLLDIVAFVYCIRGKLLMYYQMEVFKNDVVAFIDFLSELLLVAVNIVGMIGLTKTSFFVELFTFILKKHNFSPVKNISKTFTRYIQILRCLPLVPIVTGIYFIGFQLGWDIQQYFLPRDIWYYTLNLVVCAAICLTNKIKEKFIDINDHLEQLSKNNLIPFIIADKIPKEQSKLNINRPLKTNNRLEDLINLSDDYTTMCNLLDKLNHHARIHLVMLVMCITVNVLYNITVIIEFAVKPKVINGFNTKIPILVVQLMLAIVSMGQAAGAAFVGESLEEEGERTSRLCYMFLNNLNKNVSNENDKLMINEINFLLDQSKTRKIYLYAGGFFRLNWGILGSITSTVATYSIVIIQFLLK